MHAFPVTFSSVFRPSVLWRTPVTLCAAFALASPAAAQLLSGLSVEPVQIKAGEQARATINLDVMSGTNCGVRLHWGDGQTMDIKISNAKDIPFVATHAYAKPGNYELMVEPAGVAAKPKCGGRTQKAQVMVAALPATTVANPAVSATPAIKPARTCPVGWALGKTGVNKKTQAFTCSAPTNTAVPQPRLVCPGDLTYFENSKRGQLGCRI